MNTNIDRKTLAKYLDFANHHQDATPEVVRELCQKVKQYGFHAGFVNAYFIPLAREILGPDGIVGTAISFPLGQDTTSMKVATSLEAVKAGADELDVVMNVGLFKAGEQDKVLQEMKAVVGVAKQTKDTAIVKFIIETGLLTEEEIKKASQMVLESGADFVKTNSGWGPRGASLRDVELIKSVVGGKIKIKVAGGIDTYQEAISFITAGVDRIGTSHAVEIVEEAENQAGP